MKFLFFFLIVGLASADVSHILKSDNQDARAQIVEQSFDTGEPGQFQWRLKTENGIQAEAVGSLKQISPTEEAQVIQGSAAYTAPDGSPIQLSYIADENGYQPSGAHLPVPPPIPAAIVRALEYIRQNPPKEEKY